MEMLESDSEQERESAVELFLELYATPKAEQLQNIVAQLDRSETEVKLTVLNLLVRLERPLEAWILFRVRRLLEDEAPQVRCSAIACLRKHDGSQDSVLLFFHCLKDVSPEVRAVAWEALDGIFLHADFRLADYLNHEAAEIRDAARRLLLDHGHDDLIDKVDTGCWRYD
jgi:hypothetical protein